MFMYEDDISVAPWREIEDPTKEELVEQYYEEGMEPYSWSNEPGEEYPPHTHDYHKVIMVVEGSITFDFPDRDESVTLEPGDRLDIAPGITHEAVAGPDGVTCLEAHKEV